MYCYLSRNYRDTASAGNKAKTDIEAVMAGMGMRNAGLPRTAYANKAAHFAMTLAGVLKSPFSLRRGDVLVLQYPLKKYYAAVCRMARFRGAKVVTVIHDLGSFRRKALTPGQEVARLSHSDCLVAHNGSMKAYLEQAGCRMPIVTLDIFDYLSAARPEVNTLHSAPYTIVYAGALNRRKNAFLYEWGGCISTYRVRVYGNGFEPACAEGADRFDAPGYVESDGLIATVRGDFGLVWDGGSLDACTGPWGEYLKINTPHKTSLYLRCGLPLIIWSGAAMARFVSDNGIGLCVDSLRRLDDVLAAVTPEDYRRMADNVAIVSRRIASGHYIKTALEEAFEIIRNP